jgi:probable blue pigment (indigoidine) exporter
VLLALPVLAVIVGVRRPRLVLPWRYVPLYAAFGLIGVTLSYLVWATSVKLNSAPVAAALAFSAPVFVAAGERVFFGARLWVTQLAAIGVNLIGCALVAGVTSPADLWRRPEGAAVGLAVGAAFGGYTLLGRATARSRHLPPLASLFYLFAFGGVGLLIVAGVSVGSGGLRLELPWQGWLLLGALALGPTIVSNGLYNASLQSLPPTFATVCTSMEPVLVAAASVVLLGQTLSAVRVLGIALVVGAVVAMNLDVARRASAPRTPV